MTDVKGKPRVKHAVPYFISFALLPIAVWAITAGGWWIALIPLTVWILFTILDGLSGLDLENLTTEASDKDLTFYRLATMLWAPVQAIVVFGALSYVSNSDDFSAAERLGVAFGLGILSGTIGIVYAHELMHQKNKLERALGDILMTMALYGHFRSEHLLVHHRYVGTPRDAVTARYNEGFHRFFPRVLRQSLTSAWKAETELLARRQLPPLHLRNPFWKYAVLSFLWLFLAYAVAGTLGVGLFMFQALVAIWQLELVNYVEHYGLTRRHLGNGKYEPTLPHHSWNATQFATNRLLINLQRHSDHHYKPNRRFPLLQTYSEEQAPQLPHGYVVMTALAMIPPLWRRRMNPRVRAWRKKFYPDIDDWAPYTQGSNPQPR